MNPNNELGLKLAAFMANPSSAFVEKNPEILGNTALVMLQSMSKGLKSDGQFAAAKLYDECRVLFHLCRKVGAKKAFSLHKGQMTAGPELRGLLSAAEATVARAAEESSPEVAAEACLACARVIEHPRFAHLSRALQSEAFLKASGAQLIEARLTGATESAAQAKRLIEQALPLCEPAAETHQQLLANLEVATELLAAAEPAP